MFDDPSDEKLVEHASRIYDSMSPEQKVSCLTFELQNLYLYIQKEAREASQSLNSSDAKQIEDYIR